jgi:hypothetical protein
LTQEQPNNLPTVSENAAAVVTASTDPFYDKAQGLMDPADVTILKEYRDSGRMRLSPKTTAGFFELFLNGSTVKEIHGLNPAFPYAAILWARVEENWDQQKDEYIRDLQLGIREKLIKSQMETVGLLTDMLAAANKQHGDKIKKFLQTGNEADLGNAMTITSIQGMMKVIEGLQKLTGQDKTLKIKTEETVNHNVNVTLSESENLSPEAAAQILAVVAAEKRKKESEKTSK